MNTYEINGFYGHLTPHHTTVFVYEYRSGEKYYVCEGAEIVNKTFDEISEGTNVEELQDVDCFTWSSPIKSLEELINAVEY